MSYDLISQSTLLCRRFSAPFWAKALELARRCGWMPMGTRLPIRYDFPTLAAEWEGGYETNDGQRVQGEDALSLAEALEKALDDILDTNPPSDWASQGWQDDLPEWLSPEEREIIEDGLQDGLLDVMGMNPLEYFAGDEKRHLKEFIRFCRLGSFEIR